MCRLFGLHAGRNAVTATFWLLDAPDNLAAQSRRNPDGTGLGVIDAHGEPQVRKQPMAAWQDSEFACEAKELTGTTFLAHIRYATTGKLDVLNTHPFLQDGRLDTVAPGDTVIGILPVHLVARLCMRGAVYLHLSLDLPTTARGRELSADDLEAYGARLQAFIVESAT